MLQGPGVSLVGNLAIGLPTILHHGGRSHGKAQGSTTLLFCSVVVTVAYADTVMEQRGPPSQARLEGYTRCVVGNGPQHGSAVV